MTVTIGRRELLAALGGAAAAWPLAARAQQPARPRRIGLLSASPVSTLSGIYTGFIKGMRELAMSRQRISSSSGAPRKVNLDGLLTLRQNLCA